MAPSRAVAFVLALVVVMAAGIVFFLSASQGTPAGATASGTRSPGTVPSPTRQFGLASTAAPATAAARASVPAVDPISGLRTIRRSALPKEALLTLGLIAAGGPFPYDQDGTTYKNLERILPAEASGYYREYTVETPGSPDRGARRIVTGKGGEAYWTADHYASFRRILG